MIGSKVDLSLLGHCPSDVSVAGSGTSAEDRIKCRFRMKTKTYALKRVIMTSKETLPKIDLNATFYSRQKKLV